MLGEREVGGEAVLHVVLLMNRSYLRGGGCLASVWRAGCAVFERYSIPHVDFQCDVTKSI